MIQELLDGASASASASLIAGERKNSINTFLLPIPPTSSSCTTTITTSTATNVSAAVTTITSSSSENQNLRCPRCDSSNTKFCYYNNYNLTQPRHFCKTCRRYWTKGGALRNVPIGGGCRKNKNATGMSNSVVAKQTATKMKAVASELGRSPGFFEQELPQTPILWGSQQNTQLMALLRASQNPNPNPSPMSVAVKEEGNLMGSQSHMVAEPLNGLLNSRTPGYDGVGEFPSLGLCSSFWRNSQDQNQQHNNGFVLGEHQSSGAQELFHKLRPASSVNYGCSDNLPVFLGNMASSSSLCNILESSSASGSEFGCWNIPTYSWSDLPTTNGVYP
ncbi:hypothetical protein Fmac_002426 [Flemingia macrophylla]|uniref:Dof zinc finger protein n=1 Tax=Flemingia macrophylla TaxID=520843 RepID=A0ABD1NK05_9FABA